MALSENIAVRIEPLTEGTSTYGRQLADGYLFRFGRELEREYRIKRETDAAKTVPIAIGICFVLWLGLALFDLWRLSIHSEAIPQALQSAVVTSRLGVLAALGVYLVPTVRRSVPPDLALLTLFSAIGVAAAFTGAVYGSHGIVNVNIALIVLVMVAFLPIGLSLPQAAIVSVVAIAATAFAESPAAFGPNQHNGGLLVFVLIVAAAISGIAYFVRDRTQRHQFLLERVLTHVAQHDPLTGLANRRLFTEHVERALAHARREREPAGLALVDVDFFKRYNDAYGHAAGDEVLREVAGKIALIGERPLDLVARVGGEEFAIFLYGVVREDARGMLEGLVRDIHALAIPHSGSGIADCLTVSVGLAMRTRDDTLQSIYRNADIALYDAKDGGRNRLSMREA